jgi:hypothetical protein
MSPLTHLFHINLPHYPFTSHTPLLLYALYLSTALYPSTALYGPTVYHLRPSSPLWTSMALSPSVNPLLSSLLWPSMPSTALYGPLPPQRTSVPPTRPSVPVQYYPLSPVRMVLCPPYGPLTYHCPSALYGPLTLLRLSGPLHASVLPTALCPLPSTDLYSL